MKPKFKSRLKLFFPEEKEGFIALNALQPELESDHNKRSKIKIKLKKTVLSLDITAADAIALRASLNSCLKLIGLVQKISEVE